MTTKGQTNFEVKSQRGKKRLTLLDTRFISVYFKLAESWLQPRAGHVIKNLFENEVGVRNKRRNLLHITYETEIKWKRKYHRLEDFYNITSWKYTTTLQEEGQHLSYKSEGRHFFLNGEGEGFYLFNKFEITKVSVQEVEVSVGLT